MRVRPAFKIVDSFSGQLSHMGRLGQQGNFGVITQFTQQ
jgi:hypothetical protein